MMITRAYTSCRYGQMHYRMAGPERTSAPPVLLLHQNPSSSYEYELLINALAADRRVYAFDTPGYGMSDAPPEPLTMAGYAAAFSDAIDALDIVGPLDIYGYHTGTLLCAELAMLRPDRVRRIAMTGIPMFSEEERHTRYQQALAYPTPDEEGDVIRALLDNLWKYAVADRDARVSLDKALRHFADKAWVLNKFTWAYQGVWAYDYSRLAKVIQPVLLLQPAEDICDISIEAAKMLQYVTIKHLPELDRDIFDLAAPLLADELRAFFSGKAF